MPNDEPFMQKAIKISVAGAKTLPLKTLEPFQDELKTLGKEEYQKMRENILANGFCFVVHVWQNKKHNYIIDGHQRVFTVKKLEEEEGFKVPAIPVAIVKAATFKEAKLKVLAGASSYGRISEAGLEKFLKDSNLSIDQVAGQFDFLGLDFENFYQNFMENEKNNLALPDPDEYSGDNSLASSSSQVKQVQLLFNLENYQEFSEKTEFLANTFKTENITDTLMECVRAIHKIKAIKSK